jgi:tRNA threonylcarbamoyladenosine biosynthesis protein TsaE
VESYRNDIINIHHFDCYRLSDPEELEYIGIRDYLGVNHIQLIEWPALGKGTIALADMTITITGIDEQRTLSITAHTTTGKQLLQCIDS